VHTHARALALTVGHVGLGFTVTHEYATDYPYYMLSVVRRPLSLPIHHTRAHATWKPRERRESREPKGSARVFLFPLLFCPIIILRIIIIIIIIIVPYGKAVYINPRVRVRGGPSKKKKTKKQKKRISKMNEDAHQIKVIKTIT